eukprot:TRINITY_DN13620_c2_g1_i1.p2 TRINITY_DN13620_c2_g1~~TRINITY_DN13620_c2_g1_i1.p2  ORF type:complete len:242 (+),score=48.76 TRINITY_DN13620_c2_g1_i1:52-777(+)
MRLGIGARRWCSTKVNERLVEEVKKAMREGGETGKALEGLIRGDVFRRIDVNKDGRVTKDEFGRVFDEMDVNKDGVVSLEEYKGWHGKTWINSISESKHKVEASCVSKDDGKGDTPPTASQLYRTAVIVAVPMIGFGFVDNFLMIMCGDMIESHIGTLMTISTMAAAGLGNMCSDIAGLGLSKAIEDGATRLGLKSPKLTPHQSRSAPVRTVSLLASVFGISFGCILGMCPLLFHEAHSKE